MTIEVENVSFTSEGRNVLKNISWEVSSDDVWLLTGDAGSGKTALLSIMLGILKPDNGRVRLLGDYKYDRVNAGVVFQEDRLFEDMSAAENVAIVRDVTSPAVAAEDLVKLMPSEFVNVPVRELDPVNRRITAIVRATSVPSDILMMDEPFRGMGDDLRKKVFTFIKEVAGHKGIIIAQRFAEGLPPLRTLKLS
ncbi:MAG: ATP-binding cassette domain-containing protein [Lachnospiraceae bacterium]|nr:ATP-binding cassette domain-containing protein [Lachnospiraceae bacterium]